MNDMEKILIALKVIQVVSNIDRKKNGLEYLGRGFSKAYRLNPFNPLSYIIVIVAIPMTIILYGFIGFFKQVTNPFEWD
jgi:hypothetical protein